MFVINKLEQEPLLLKTLIYTEVLSSKLSKRRFRAQLLSSACIFGSELHGQSDVLNYSPLVL